MISGVKPNVRSTEVGESSMLNREELKLSLLESLGYKPFKDVRPKKRYRCKKCKELFAKWSDLEPHHIVYTSKKVTYLCPPCHLRVTHLNRLKAREVHRKLTNDDRHEVWKVFLKEKTSKVQYLESFLGKQEWDEQIK